MGDIPDKQELILNAGQEFDYTDDIVDKQEPILNAGEELDCIGDDIVNSQEPMLNAGEELDPPKEHMLNAGNPRPTGTYTGCRKGTCEIPDKQQTILNARKELDCTVDILDKQG